MQPKFKLAKPNALRAGLLIFSFAFSLFDCSAAECPANRWLLIVETSRATQTRAESVAQTAGNLILSGMNGQMRNGDTLGLWTFNTGLHTGELPLQTWSTNTAKTSAEQVAMFVATRKFQGRPDFNKVLPALEKVVTNSEFITVVVISSGGEKFRGTPYDSAINTIHHQWQSQQAKAGRPFVTVLRAQAGRLVDFKVNTPPAPLEMPELPPELLVTNVVAEKPAQVKTVHATPAPEPSPAVVVPSLIVHGKKAEPAIEPVTNAIATNAVAPVLKSNPPVVIAQARPPQPPPPAKLIVTNPPATNSVAAISTNPAVTPAATGNASNLKLIVIIAVAVAATGLGVFMAFARRARAQPRASLITRSLDRDSK